MPPIVRTFIVVMIRVPGALLRYGGGFGAALSLGFQLMWDLGSKHWLMLLAFWTAAPIGHLMQALANHVLGENGYHIAANQIGQRLTWDLAIDSILIGIAGAGIALAPCLSGERWQPAAVAATLFVGLFYLLFLTHRKREAFFERWLREHANDPHPPS